MDFLLSILSSVIATAIGFAIEPIFTKKAKANSFAIENKTEIHTHNTNTVNANNNSIKANNINIHQSNTNNNINNNFNGGSSETDDSYKTIWLLLLAFAIFAGVLFGYNYLKTTLYWDVLYPILVLILSITSFYILAATCKKTKIKDSEIERFNSNITITLFFSFIIIFIINYNPVINSFLISLNDKSFNEIPKYIFF